MDVNTSKFKHKYQVRVRNFEVDAQGIVHNAIYLEYCEIGRVEYVRTLGLKLSPLGIINDGFRVNVRRNEIDYEAPARLDDLIDVYTRISYIKNSSFCFEHLLVNSETGQLLSIQKSIQVHLNFETNRPERLPDRVRSLVIEYEGNDVELLN